MVAMHSQPLRYTPFTIDDWVQILLALKHHLRSQFNYINLSIAITDVIEISIILHFLPVVEHLTLQLLAQDPKRNSYCFIDNLFSLVVLVTYDSR